MVQLGHWYLQYLILVAVVIMVVKPKAMTTLVTISLFMIMGGQSSPGGPCHQQGDRACDVPTLLGLLPAGGHDRVWAELWGMLPAFLL